MPKAIELLKQGHHEELWQMCCGYLKLSMPEFMELQNNLLLQQIEILWNSPIGKKIMRGAKPKTVDEFRRLVPLTDYKDYCPELLEQREDVLPEKPEMWAHTSGRSGDYACKWIPLPKDYVMEMSKVLYGLGMMSCADYWGDVSKIPDNIKLLYGVAPRPYISGTFADVLRLQSPFKYLPDLETAENLPYEKRIATGFKQALNEGVDYFFGLSLVLVKVGEKLRDSSSKVDIREYLGQPRALWRLVRALVKSKIAGRPILPKDLWSIKGMLGSGVDSGIYKEKIKELWGRQTLDLYTSTEGGVLATQTWDYGDLTFIPTLNFFEFIPEDELLKWQMDRSYRMKTVLMDEVEVGKSYEIVISGLHGMPLMRYRIGDMIKITSLGNEKLGINIPQLDFERRVDDVINFAFVRLNEKAIWQAIEKSGVEYNDWIAFKNLGETELRILIEPKNDTTFDESVLSETIYRELTQVDDQAKSLIPDEYARVIDFKVNVSYLPKGAFDNYTALRQAQGADLAHLKPPHINPSDRVLALLLGQEEETIVVEKTKKGIETEAKTGDMVRNT
ncbi:MAG: GH3 auxin-responsive promoter family protein [Dehalococcoidales bacterium]|nr:GH3 auxin-responsive promoter family protein [Dehalococcoidales bacterium]